MEPGIHTLTADKYHAIEAVSASTINMMLQQSPLHAHTALLSDEQDESTVMDIGTICHALLLEGADKAYVIKATRWEGKGKDRVDTGEPVEDWKTVAAREERDAARGRGQFPILARMVEPITAMIKACRSQLAAHEDASGLFEDGKPEQSLIWYENGVRCKARLDWLKDSYTEIADYKTTGASANPDVTSRTLFQNGWDVQAAWYLRGLLFLAPRKDVVFRFCVQETFAPYALSVISLDAAALTLAEKKCDWAVKVWAQCQASNVWPGYRAQTAMAELPTWFDENEWMAQHEL